MTTTRFIIRPLRDWLDPVTDPRRSASAFRATWDDTLDLLCAEVEWLGGDQIVLQVDVTDAELRRDGMLRTHAQVGFPGVRVSFNSVHGPLTYSTDAYEARYAGGLRSWQANVRAIALGLEALRAVDRYGISSRGQQYTGWTAIGSKPAVMTRDQAAEFIAYWAEPDQREKADAAAAAIKRGDPDALKVAYLRAARRAHPDFVKDDGDTMARLNQARELLKERAST